MYFVIIRLFSGNEITLQRLISTELCLVLGKVKFLINITLNCESTAVRSIRRVAPENTYMSALSDFEMFIIENKRTFSVLQ